MSATIDVIPKDQWRTYFQELASTHQGWAVTLELLAGEMGDQHLMDGLPFQGISYETEGSQAGDVLVEAGDAGTAFELTSSIVLASSAPPPPSRVPKRTSRSRTTRELSRWCACAGALNFRPRENPMPRPVRRGRPNGRRTLPDPRGGNPVADLYPSSGDEVSENSGVVKVYVRELDQLFDSMDPSPFHEKALDADAEEYIVAAAKELPSGAPEALVVMLDRPLGLPDEGRILGDAIRRHFAREAQLLQWKLRRLLRGGAISLVIGLIALAAALAGGQGVARAFGGGHLATVLGQSLQIGGCVAMWHPMEIFLYKWWPLLAEQRLYARLSRMPVQIMYTDSPNVADKTTKGDGDETIFARNGRRRPVTVGA